MKGKLTPSETRRIKKVKLYSEKEFRSLTGAHNRQERLLAAVVDGYEELLSETDFNYVQLLKNAFRILTTELSPHVRDQKIMQLLEIPSRRRLIQIKNDVNYIFCDIEETNIVMERRAMEHKISSLLELLVEKDPGHKSIPELLKLLDKIKGTSIHESAALPWEEWHIPLPEYSTDINDLNPALNIEYEEIPPEQKTQPPEDLL